MGDTASWQQLERIRDYIQSRLSYAGEVGLLTQNSNNWERRNILESPREAMARWEYNGYLRSLNNPVKSGKSNHEIGSIRRMQQGAQVRNCPSQEVENATELIDKSTSRLNDQRKVKNRLYWGAGKNGLYRGANCDHGRTLH